MIGPLCIVTIELSELLPVSLLFSQLFSRRFFSQLLLAFHVLLLLVLFLDFMILFDPNTVLQIVQVIEPFNSLRLLGLLCFLRSFLVHGLAGHPVILPFLSSA